MAKSGGGQGASILFGGPPAGREAHFVLFILDIDSFFIFTFFVPFFSTSFFFYTSNKRNIRPTPGQPGERTGIDDGCRSVLLIPQFFFFSPPRTLI